MCYIHKIYVISYVLSFKVLCSLYLRFLFLLSTVYKVRFCTLLYWSHFSINDLPLLDLPRPDPPSLGSRQTNAIGGRKRIAQTASFNKLMMEVLGEWGGGLLGASAPPAPWTRPHAGARSQRSKPTTLVSLFVWKECGTLEKMICSESFFISFY